MQENEGTFCFARIKAKYNAVYCSSVLIFRHIYNNNTREYDPEDIDLYMRRLLLFTFAYLRR